MLIASLLPRILLGSFDHEQILSGEFEFTDSKLEVYSHKAGFPFPPCDLEQPMMVPSQHTAQDLVAGGGRGGCVFGA